jgi:hypothetical protein
MKPKYSALSILTITLLSAGLVTGVITGCQKLSEDPKASITPGSFYKTQSDLDAAVAGVYVLLARDGSWGFTSKETTYFGSDDLTTDPALNKQNQREFDQLNGSSLNGDVPTEWNGPWNAIAAANFVIANYNKVPAPDATSQTNKTQSAGQAFFLRGLCYYYLVRTFGPLPLVTAPLDPTARPPRSPVDSVYALIISDLTQAKTMLGSGKVQGKPNKYSASAILADVYLTMAGWPLNDQTKYQASADEATIVMNSNLYSTNIRYDSIFTTRNSTESIFALQYSVAGNLPNRRFGSTNVPLDEVAVDGSSGWDDVYPEINFYKNRPNCARSYYTFYDTLKIRQADHVTFLKVLWSDPSTHARHPYYKKFRTGLITNGVGDGVNETATQILTIQPSTNAETIISRYAGVLLDYAEASDMASNGPTAASYAAINQVRSRAGLPNLTPGLSATAFRDSVVYERAYEFAEEFGVRWFDIVRLQLLPQVVAGRDPSENQILGTNLNQRYLAPIPLTEMTLNPSWKQNDGY